MTISEFQKIIFDIYFEKDSKRGINGTFTWFVEEVGELAKAVRQKDKENLKEEFADVFAWLVSLASICRINMEECIKKYEAGCPKCNVTPCKC